VRLPSSLRPSCRQPCVKTTPSAINGRAPQAELPGSHGWRQTCFNQLERGSDLLRIEGLTAGTLAAGPRGGDPVFCPLGNQTPLEMRDGPEYMKDQLAGGRVGVDPFLQAEQGNAPLLKRHSRIAENATHSVSQTLSRPQILGEIDQADLHAGADHPMGRITLSSAWRQSQLDDDTL
jgi:hypothetical protein